MSLSLGIHGLGVHVARLAPCLNLVRTGVFLLWVRRLLGPNPVTPRGPPPTATPVR